MRTKLIESIKTEFAQQLPLTLEFPPASILASTKGAEGPAVEAMVKS